MVLLDIEMPNTCNNCSLWQCFDGIYNECKARDKSISVDVNESKPDWCPIMPINTAAGTNGDVIKTLFPNISVSKHPAGGIRITSEELAWRLDLPTNWWNAPYKKEG